ncbi:FHA domain-containing protein [Aquisphaera insulae]|uniref:FHA domain-containing protein n=1 Tax=Aquisphaera insulae TaxID=2712864 RepID=UPI0013EC0FC2|nr:FHA domain-containing protein [Aquisphaera insulae]
MPTPAGPAKERWILEIVRGLEPGRAFEPRSGENVLGNALAGASGLDLSGQEPAASPRRMAARQACVILSGGGLSIRDLDSPGGTFVNRQRLFTGQARPLQPGDLIQLGGVQLEVRRVAASTPSATPSPSPSPPSPRTRAQPAPPPPRPTAGGALPAAFTMGGATCRTWDDFLPLAAQRWGQLRDALTSGQLTDYLRRIGRPDLLPSIVPGGDPDEQLDAWLGRLPASQPGEPELDVHPAAIVVRAPAGGGTIRQTLRVTNVGFRLLRSQVSVEAPGTPGVGLARPRIRVAPGIGGGPFATIDQTDVPIEIDLPEEPSRGGTTETLGAVIVRSNGGVRRIEVRAERPPRAEVIPATYPAASPLASHAATAATLVRPMGDRLASQPPARRVAVAAIAFMIFRGLVLASGLLPTILGAGSTLGHWSELRLAGMTIVLGAAGAVVGAGVALRGRRGDGSTVGDVLPMGFAGAILGVFAAAIGFALIQCVELPLGGWASSSAAVICLWGVLGAAIGLLSLIVVPASSVPSSPSMEPTR